MTTQPRADIRGADEGLIKLTVEVTVDPHSSSRRRTEDYVRQRIKSSMQNINGATVLTAIYDGEDQDHLVSYSVEGGTTEKIQAEVDQILVPIDPGQQPKAS